MTSYIEDVCNSKKNNSIEIGKNYWIRSIGSDLYKNEEHALFFGGEK